MSAVDMYVPADPRHSRTMPGLYRSALRLTALAVWRELGPLLRSAVEELRWAAVDDAQAAGRAVLTRIRRTP